MTDISEAAATAGTPIGGVLQPGLDTLSLNQEVAFVKYIRVVLPIDGFVFLVRADLLTPQALADATASDPVAAKAPLRFTQKGSLHYSTSTSQDETKTYTKNEVIFSSEDALAPLNLVNPAVFYLGEIDDIRYVFAERGRFYRQARVWHYRGATRWSDLASQVIDSADQLDLTHRVVSNSLPIWLAMPTYAPPVAIARNPGITFYPSYLVPRNLVPPYGVIHCRPEGTDGIASAPTYTPLSTYGQLCRDVVDVTLYGVRSDQAFDLITWIEQFINFNPNVMGLMNVSVVRDEKQGQVELNAIAMKKRIEFEVNYFQHRVDDLARQTIMKAFLTVNAEEPS